nr:MAG TPA: hypothetical protein [Caudoviricetes sp.]
MRSVSYGVIAIFRARFFSLILPKNQIRCKRNSSI